MGTEYIKGTVPCAVHAIVNKADLAFALTEVTLRGNRQKCISSLLLYVLKGKRKVLREDV